MDLNYSIVRMEAKLMEKVRAAKSVKNSAR